MVWSEQRPSGASVQHSEKLMKNEKLKARTGLDVLRGIEDEFRNQYYIIRNTRGTNWAAVNRTRVLAQFMHILGVPRWAVREARYCLRLRVCERCYGAELRCHSICGRMQRGDFEAEI
jgi:hypothetical protein